MKIFKFLTALAVTVTLFSCSAPDNDSSATTPPPTADYFNLTYNGTAKTVSISNAIRQEDHIEVAVDTQDGLGLSLKFNIYGNLYQSFTHPTSPGGPIPFQTASAYYRSNTFAFSLVHLDTANKKITVTFSGKVYDDEYDLTSAFSTVSGSFQMSYSDYPPAFTGMGTYAKINGADWHGLESSSSSSSTDVVTILNVENDSEYNIGIAYPYYAPVTGTFAFTSNANNKRITFSKYDVATHTPVEYNVNGTITYIEVNSTLVRGTFSLTATHPTNGSTITISNGTFKEASAY